jgi:phage I-like protein
MDATKATPTNPETETPTKMLTGKPSKSVAKVVASITGTNNRKEQIGKLHALADAQEQIGKLTQRVEKMDARRRGEKIVRKVDEAVKAMRLPPAKRDRAIKLGQKHGIGVLREYLSALPKQGLVKRTETREPVVNPKLVAANITAQDRAVMEKLGIDEKDFVASRIAHETQSKTGKARSSN